MVQGSAYFIRRTRINWIQSRLLGNVRVIRVLGQDIKISIEKLQLVQKLSTFDILCRQSNEMLHLWKGVLATNVAPGAQGVQFMKSLVA